MFSKPCELARRLAREAEAVCRHYLQWKEGGAVLAGRRCPQRPRALTVRAAPGLTERLRRKMD